jgi:hypothetical protein
VLFLEDRRVGIGSGEQVAVEAGEIAVEPLLADDRLDAVDGGDLGGADLACGVDAAGLDQDVVIVVELGGEVAGGARRHAAADRAAVEHDDAAAGARKLIGDREPGDPRPDDGNVRRRVRVERRRIDRRALAPQRPASFRARVHGALPARL